MNRYWPVSPALLVSRLPVSADGRTKPSAMVAGNMSKVAGIMSSRISTTTPEHGI